MKRLILPILLVLALVAAIAYTLFHNKQELDAARQPEDRSVVPVAVRTALASQGKIVLNAEFPATLRPFEEANLTAQASGMISSLSLELGQEVKKGQVVGKLDTRITELNLKSAEISQAKLKMDYDRAKELYENQAGLETAMINAKYSYDNAAVQQDLIRQQIANAEILSPLSGTVSARNIKQGEFVNPGTPIATITDVRSLKATVFVDQQTVYSLKKGQQGQIRSSIFPEKTFTGTIIYISPKADANHNYQVDMLLAQTSALKAGTDIFVSFGIGQARESLTIPASALLTDRAEPFVYVIENGRAVGRSVRTGAIVNGQAEIISGLKAGEEVVVSGQINLREGSNTTIVR